MPALWCGKNMKHFTLGLTLVGNKVEEIILPRLGFTQTQNNQLGKITSFKELFLHWDGWSSGYRAEVVVLETPGEQEKESVNQLHAWMCW